MQILKYLLLLIIFGWLYSEVGAAVFWTLIGLWFLIKISGKKKSKSKSKSRRAQEVIDDTDWCARAVEKLGDPEELAEKANTLAKIKRLEERARAREEKAYDASLSESSHDRILAEAEVLGDAAAYARDEWDETVVSMQLEIDCDLSTPMEILELDGIVVSLEKVKGLEDKLDKLECAYCFNELSRSENPNPPNPLINEMKRVRAILDSCDNKISAAEMLSNNFKPTQEFSSQYLHKSFSSSPVDQWLFAILSSEPCGLKEDVLLKLFAKGIRTAEDLQNISELEIHLNSLPLPASFKRSKINLRAIIKEKKKKLQPFAEELKQLYILTAKEGFIYKTKEVEGHYCYDIANNEHNKWDRLEMPYTDIGYAMLDCNKTDVRWYVEEWGEPQKHEHARDYHQDTWNALLRDYKLTLEEAKEKSRREWREIKKGL